ncbi:MAG: dTDP-4-dehydrorhamnose 3,5-epimerase family protein [Pseudomonadota bacterium]
MSAVSIQGVLVTPLRQIVDERGAVLHMLRADSEGYAGFGECYFSQINVGIIKGWKRHLRQTQQLAVPSGRVRFVVCDLRDESPTRGTCVDVTLGRPDSYYRLTIPPQVWYGFACVGDQISLVVNCADMPHEAGESETRPLEDFELPQALDILRGTAA